MAVAPDHWTVTPSSSFGVQFVVADFIPPDDQIPANLDPPLPHGRAFGFVASPLSTMSQEIDLFAHGFTDIVMETAPAMTFEAAFSPHACSARFEFTVELLDDSRQVVHTAGPMERTITTNGQHCNTIDPLLTFLLNQAETISFSISGYPPGVRYANVTIASGPGAWCTRQIV